MALALLRTGTVVSRSDMFRIASLFLYLAMLVQITIVGNVSQLLGIDAMMIAIGSLALLFLVALGRYIWPELVTYGNGPVLSELVIITAVVGTFALTGISAALPLPWLIGVAGVFPLMLEGPFALVGVVGIAAAAFLINHQLQLPLASWLPLAYATVFAGLLSRLLSGAIETQRSATQQARVYDRRFDALAHATRHVFMIFDSEYQLKYVNHALQEIIGFSHEEIASPGFEPELHPDDVEQHKERLHYLRDTPASEIFSRYRTRHKLGHWIWLESHGFNLLHDNAINGLIFSIEDITARHEIEAKLDEEHALLRTVLDLNPSMIYAKDMEGRFTISNLAFQQRFGFDTEAPLRGRTAYEIFLASAPESLRQVAYDKADMLHQQDLQVIQAGNTVEDLEVQGIWDGDKNSWYRTTKYPLLDSRQTIVGMLAITRDITDRKEYELRLEHQALHDPLTGLPNRRYLLKAIGDGIVDFRLHHKKLTILFCDLDLFKNVNDMHGHDIGDKCLRECTRRISAELPSTDFVTRFGGNEFVILTNASLVQASAKAQALLRVISQPLLIDDVSIKIHASIGIAQLTPDHKNSSDLLRDADAAMYQAKERGRNRAEIFDATLQTTRTKRTQMEIALGFALERQELSVMYQPKVSMHDGRVTGFELLLRWTHPSYGRISPDEFIPIAENSGQIIPIGLWVLEQACHQLYDWQQRFAKSHRLTMAVNVSMRQLLQASFLTEVSEVLRRTKVVPQQVELELTETAVMANPLQTIDNLNHLKRLGLRLALDDFGTGYSSLAYLQKLPIDVLKIDKAFVFGLGTNPSDTEIVRLILALAQTMQLDTVAEGVETSAQMAALKELGCFTGQGYLFLPAVSAQEAEELLESGRTFSVQ